MNDWSRGGTEWFCCLKRRQEAAERVLLLWHLTIYTEESFFNTARRTKARGVRRQLNVRRLRSAKKVKMFVLFLKREAHTSPFRLIGRTWQWLTCSHGNRAANLPSPIGNHRRGAWLSFSSPPSKTHLGSGFNSFPHPTLKNTSRLRL